MGNDYLDIPFTRPYSLSEKSLDNIKDSLAKAINCRVEQIKVQFDKNKGYYFYGPYNICIADLLFERSEYRGVQIYGGVIEDLKVQLEDERRRVAEEARRNQIMANKAAKERKIRERKAKRRKYVLQKYVIPGVAITAIGIGSLVGIGAIRDAISKEPVSIVQQVQNLNTIANANDLLLFNWSNYAMCKLADIASASDYDHIRELSDNLKEGYFTPIMNSYYNYLEESTLGLPIELIGEAIKTNHNSFRNNAYLFDEELQAKSFGSCSFANSPFANALIVDAYGQVISSSDSGLFGEVYDSNGELITLDSEMGYTIYVRAEDVIGNDYGTSNYPEDALMYKGVAYVNSSHLYDYEAPSKGSK